MSNKKPWKTLGISTSSRVWVTYSDSFFGSRNEFNNLTLSGQTLTTSFKTHKMSFWTGRLFTTFRTLVQLLIAYLLLKWFILGLKASYHSFMLTITSTTPLAIFWTCTLLAIFFIIWWLPIATSGTMTSVVVGGLALMFFSLSATMLKVLSTFGKHFIRGPRPSSDVLTLNIFADLPKVTPDQKKFVLVAYKLLAGLIQLSAPMVQPCNPFVPHGYTHTSPRFYPALNKLQFITTFDLVKTRKWPTLSHDKLEILKGRTLLLYHWRNIHADGARIFKTSAIWTSHKLGNDVFTLQKVLTLASQSKTTPTTPNQPSNWLLHIIPTKLLVTTLLKNSKTPLRFDLAQHLSVLETPTWSTLNRKA